MLNLGLSYYCVSVSESCAMSRFHWLCSAGLRRDTGVPNLIRPPLFVPGTTCTCQQGRKPFAPQLALMSKLLMGVQRRENCLLESPTGTGKTLALLSAALAWQRQQREHGLAMESECQIEGGDKPMINEGPHEPQQSFDDFRYVEPKAEPPVELAYEDDSVVPSKGQKPPAKDETRARFYGDDFDDDVFESPKKKRQKAPKPQARSPHKGDIRTSDSEVDGGSSPTTASPVTPGAERDPSEELDSPASYASASGSADLGPAASSQPATKTAPPRVKSNKQGKRAQKPRRRVPRVFFCSRTHSQLNQVVAELRTCRTAFQDTSAVGIGEDGKPFSMALLASRKSTCINKEGEVPSMPYSTTHV